MQEDGPTGWYMPGWYTQVKRWEHPQIRFIPSDHPRVVWACMLGAFLTALGSDSARVWGHCTRKIWELMVGGTRRFACLFARNGK